MNYTFHRVASFCSLRLSYYTTAAILAITFLVLVFTDYRSASPLYILLTLAVLPSAIKAMFFSKLNAKKSEDNLAYPLFCKKFRYNSIQYKSMSISYVLLFVLLAAWHLSYSHSTQLPFIITFLPLLHAFISLSVRIISVLVYRLYFHFFPLHAMR